MVSTEGRLGLLWMKKSEKGSGVMERTEAGARLM